MKILSITAYFLFLILLVLSSSSCDALYRMLHKEGAEEKELVGEIVPFEKNPTIEEIQTLLKIYGYNPGKIDGVLGLQTRNAIAKFQKDNNLKETRFADKETWEKLARFKDNELIENGRLNVALVQEILKVIGYDLGKVDGKFGFKTQEAIKEFQKSRSLKVDGKVGYKTLSELSNHLIIEYTDTYE